MDLEIAEPATDTSMSRRSLVTRAGAAGLAGLAAAFVIDRSALVAAAAPDQPNIPTDADMALLDQVIGLELAVTDLYTAALDQATDDLAVAVGVMASNHQAYAQAIAGATGLSASGRNDEVYDANIAAFTGSSTDFLAGAHTLEQMPVTTHTELLGRYESADAIALTAQQVEIGPIEYDL